MIAIIPAAGLGTRFLPATKAQPKEMLPVLDKPVIQHVVEEALEAGADEVVIVSSRSKRSIEEHFASSPELAATLRERGKDEYASLVEDAGNLSVSFAYQEEPLGLGHAIACAASKVDSERFLVLLGDTILTDSAIDRRMLEISDAHDGASVIAVFNVAPEDVVRYGIISGEAAGDGLWKVDALVEKPSIEEAPSNLAVFGRYLLSARVMELLADAKPGKGGEVQLTDALDALLSEQDMYALEIDASKCLDTGTIPTWIESNVRAALDDPRFADQVRAALQSLDI